LRCDVEVFSLHVRKQANIWAESQERMTKWFKARDALQALDGDAQSIVLEDFVILRGRANVSVVRVF
jgi:hypothetical protein